MPLKTFLQFAEENTQGQDVPPTPMHPRTVDHHEIQGTLRDLAVYYASETARMVRFYLKHGQDIREDFLSKLQELQQGLVRMKGEKDADTPVEKPSGAEDYNNTVTPPSADRQGSPGSEGGGG